MHWLGRRLLAIEYGEHIPRMRGIIFERRVSVLERKIIDYIVVCINEFALSKNLTEQEAFRYLYANKGIEFLTENYDIEHTLSLQDAVNDLSIVCRNNGGMIQ